MFIPATTDTWPAAACQEACDWPDPFRLLRNGEVEQATARPHGPRRRSRCLLLAARL